MMKGSTARVRDAAQGVPVVRPAGPATWTNPSSGNPLHGGLTPAEREVIQDWMARRYLQLHEKQVGRRRNDLPMPASVRSPSQVERLTNYLRTAK